jgi:hypothetical protein
LSCCANPVPSACDVYGTLDAALTTVGHFVRREDSRAVFSAVQYEINGDRPMGCRVVWAAGAGAHFVAIGGWQVMADGTEFVEIHDPFYGSTTLPYAQFVSGYRQPGDAWKNSYFTHPSPAPAGGAVDVGAPTNA